VQRTAFGAAVEQRAVPGVGHHQLAVGVGHQPGQLGPPVGVVDADHRHPAERRRAEPEEVVRDVVEQHPDVRWTPHIDQLAPEREPAAALGDQLAPAPGAVLEDQRGAVALRPAGQLGGHGVGAHRLTG